MVFDKQTFADVLAFARRYAIDDPFHRQQISAAYAKAVVTGSSGDAGTLRDFGAARQPCDDSLYLSRSMMAEFNMRAGGAKRNKATLHRLVANIKSDDFLKASLPDALALVFKTGTRPDRWQDRGDEEISLNNAILELPDAGDSAAVTAKDRADHFGLILWSLDEFELNRFLRTAENDPPCHAVLQTAASRALDKKNNFALRDDPRAETVAALAAAVITKSKFLQTTENVRRMRELGFEAGYVRIMTQRYRENCAGYEADSADILRALVKDGVSAQALAQNLGVIVAEEINSGHTSFLARFLEDTEGQISLREEIPLSSLRKARELASLAGDERTAGILAAAAKTDPHISRAFAGPEKPHPRPA